MSMIEQHDLELCPCCGAKAELADNDFINFGQDKYEPKPLHDLVYRVCCVNPVCGVTTNFHIEYIEAVKRWNKRISNHA